MRAGDLRHRIEIGRYVEEQDPKWGDPTRSWQPIATVWADMRGLSGRLYFEARQTNEQSDHRIVIRFRRGIEAGMIVRYDGHELEIQSVLDSDGRRERLELVCREVKPI